MRFLHCTSLATTVALALASPRAEAQSVAAADALFQEGQAALERGQLDIACPKLRESDRLDPANGTKLNLADCEEKRGRLASAWELYRKLADTLPAEDQRLPYVRSRVDALNARIPRLTLALAKNAPADTQAALGTAVFTAASFGTALPLDPGAKEVIVTSGSLKRSYQVTLKEGEAKTLEITPLGDAPASLSAQQPASTSSSATTDTPSHGSNTKTLGYALGGVGVVGLAVGTITGIIGLNKQGVGNDNCDDVRRVCNQTGFDANASAHSMRTISTTGFVIGLVGVGAGAYFVLTSSSDEKMAFGARLNGESASLAVNGRW